MNTVQPSRIGRRAAWAAASVWTSTRRQRVVEHEDAGPADDRPREGEALALAAGQRQALLADAGVEAPREVEGEAGLRDLESAAATSASVASGLPMSRFSRTDAENSDGSSKAKPTWRRRLLTVRSRRSWPSSVMRPSVGS